MSAPLEHSEVKASMAAKLTAALAYATASSLIMLINKIVLTGYGFPSFLFVACLQYVFSITALVVQRQLGAIRPFPLFSLAAMRDVYPVSIVFLANTVSGLGATKRLNLPLFTLLRRFSIVMTMVLEVVMLEKQFTTSVKASVGTMVLGATIGAASDLTMEPWGAAMVFFNNIATALQGVGLRKKMDQLANTELGTAGIMYYNNLLSLPCIAVLTLLKPGEVESLAKFEHWGNAGFVFLLCLCAGMGFIFNATYYWCTMANSPTTTAIVGASKNILTAYAGMVLFGDYVYSTGSFVGINLSVAGSLWYNWEELKKIRRAEEEKRRLAAAGETGAVAVTGETGGEEDRVLPSLVSVHGNSLTSLSIRDSAPATFSK